MHTYFGLGLGTLYSYCPGHVLAQIILSMKKTPSVSKVLIISRFNDKILEHHFLVHEGCVILMFYLPQEPKVVFQNFIIEPTDDKYFKK